ncbi:MAG: nuclear transport factor 2 family protein [Proteobacteria bacterium]|nr:nuclear transport factor 2 family protein [Pseudomonadota bacterium]
METNPQELETAQRLIDLHFEIWNHTDRAARLAKFEAAYAPEFFVADHAGKAVGFEQVNQLIERVHSEHAGFVFSPATVTWNHGLGRVTWGYGPPEQPHLIRGEDIFTVSHGRLSSAHVFIENTRS